MSEHFYPPGRIDRQPLVEVYPKVVRRFGEPSVDYDALDTFFRKEFKVPKKVVPHIKIKKLKGRVMGYNMGGIIALDPFKVDSSREFSELLNHESWHLYETSRETSHKVKKIVLKTLGIEATIGIGVFAQLRINGLLGTAIILPTGGYIAYQLAGPRNVVRSSKKAEEQRAVEKEKDKHLIEAYGNVIVFPKPLGS